VALGRRRPWPALVGVVVAGDQCQPLGGVLSPTRRSTRQTPCSEMRMPPHFSRASRPRCAAARSRAGPARWQAPSRSLRVRGDRNRGDADPLPRSAAAVACARRGAAARASCSPRPSLLAALAPLEGGRAARRTPVVAGGLNQQATPGRAPRASHRAARGGPAGRCGRPGSRRSRAPTPGRRNAARRARPTGPKCIPSGIVGVLFMWPRPEALILRCAHPAQAGRRRLIPDPRTASPQRP
jgi:hypothetical protein